MSASEILVLFLSGGQSQRMGTDKALLTYAGRGTEVERWKAIFDQMDLPCYWSQRPQQYPAKLFPQIPRLIDQNPGSGPLGALVSAHRRFPEHAWLVLACDWPLLGLEDMQFLLSERQLSRAATSFVVAGQRQPLCTLYEKEFLRAAALAWDAGEQSLHRRLKSAAVHEVLPQNEKNFLNVNDPALRETVLALLDARASTPSG